MSQGIAGSCPSPFDVLRLRVEDLGPTLYVRASYQDPWLNLIPRDTYPVGAGLARSAFTIGRSEPSTDEETWNPITTSSGGVYTGSCNNAYNQTYVGYKEVIYAPETFALVGPPICQTDLTLNWDSMDFWDKYFQALEKRNTQSITNRLKNVYMNYSTKVVATGNGTLTEIPGNFTTQPPGTSVDMTGVPTPACGLTQDMLDSQAISLNEAGAFQENSNGWLNMGEDGPVYPMLIGERASQQILLNNAELRQDYRAAFMGAKDLNPVIQRLGASRVIKNFRHMITLFPPRWNVTNGVWTRVPTWVMSTAATDASKGEVAIVNPNWKNPSYANVEAAIVMNPWVMTEEVLQPVNAAPGMKWTAQNYFGEWRFVTGNDAFLGIAGCQGISDPLHEQGRHFAVYRHANKPIFPDYGRTIFFLRCANVIDCSTCS